MAGALGLSNPHCPPGRTLTVMVRNGGQRISEITRQEIVDRILMQTPADFPGRFGLIPFLKRVWPLSQMPSTDSRFKDAEGDIWQHMVNNDDWTMHDLLVSRLKILGIPDQKFGVFLETLVHPLNIPDRASQEERVEWINKELVNDAFELRKTEEISSRPIYKLSPIGGGELGNAYEVVLSFAGEDRTYVEQVAEILKAHDVALFYDNYEEASLWGKNLVEHLHKVYSGSGRYCVMFISAAYAQKVWPTHERRSAFEKAIESKEEYILPARFDDTEIPGLHKHIGYVDLRRKTPKELAKLIMQKLGHSVDGFESNDPFPKISNDEIPF
ncbi:AbiJ-related protein [Edaphobacter flagellatus]|uniref:AbiJ-related protein n=1 Tax=Edaphobacter flagellatus TaxID=1933044 RepID=UPI0021B39184|nr:TIR domain-containing protein [Edaphobacter flagellatus]